MLVLYRENGVLYVESKMDLKYPLIYNGTTYRQCSDIKFEDIDVVRGLLMLNGRVLINLDGKFVKPNLYDLEMTMINKKYSIVEGLPTVKVEEKEEVVEAAEFKVVEEVVETEPEEVEEDEQSDEDNEDEANKNNKNRKKRNNNNNSKEGDK